jgi:hypothetical protein
MKHYITKTFFCVLLLSSASLYADSNNNTCTLSVTVYGDGVVCNGASNGMLYASVSGGTPPYTYKWSPTGGSKDTATGLVSDYYTVYVTDFTGCSDSAVGYLQDDYVVITISGNDTICGSGCTGALTTTGLGGTPPYTYSWSNGMTTYALTGLCAGTYAITFTDASGCVAKDSASVSIFPNIPSLVVTPTYTDATCAGDYDGSIVLAASAPTSPFRYEWGNKYGTNGIYNIAPGTYTVTLWDSKNNCTVLSYKDTAANSNCGHVTGTTFNDTTFTCTYIATDPTLQCSYLTINPGAYTIYPNLSGYYSGPNLPYGSYTVTQTMVSGSPFGSCSPTQSVIIGSSTPATNFPDTTHALLSDPAIMYLYSSIALPDYPFTSQFSIKNIGTDTSFGRTFITVPDSMTFISTSPAYTLISNDTVYWNYSSLLPGDSLNYTLNCSTYSLPYGWFYASVTAGVLPSNPESNTKNDVQSYVSPWAFADDPNYKSVSPPGTGPQGYISLADSVLTYIIHFQNTGTAAARNIYVLDTIDTHLDINTLDVLGSSNTYSYQVKGNVVKFIFSNINLPDSSTTPSGSQAWIQYTVKQKSGNKNGDVIHNTGYVYFDYNAPVVTNTTTNTIKVPLGISPTHFSQPGMSLYPNPASDNVQLSYTLDKATVTTIQIIDLLGNIVYQENKGQQQAGAINENISTSMLATGTYMVKLTTNNLTSIKKLVIIR